MKDFYMGIDVGGTKISYGLFNGDGEIVYRDRQNSDDKKSAEDFFGDVSNTILEFEKKSEEFGGVLESVGIGVPGFVNFESGSLSKVASLPKLSDFAARDYIKKKVGIPNLKVVLDNDGHCGALAEYKHGAGKGHRNMIYALISTGIGSSFVLDGKLFRGSNGAAGESGHMITCVSDDYAHDCMCGNRGCFNSLGSGKAITNYVRQWIANGEESILAGKDITAKEISEAYDKGDAVAIKAIKQMAHYLGAWIFDVYMLMNIDCIVFSGGLLAMGDKLFGEIKKEFESYHTNGFDVELVETKLGSDSCLIGAMELGRE